MCLELVDHVICIYKHKRKKCKIKRKRKINNSVKNLLGRKEVNLLKIPNFTKPELDYIKKWGNLTEREEMVLELRNKDYPPTIEEIAEILDTSPSTVSRIIKNLKKKIIKLL